MRNQGVQSIVPARKLENDKDRPVLSRCGLNEGVRRMRIHRQESAL